MKNTGSLVFIVMLTAVVSTAVSFFLFKNYYAPDLAFAGVPEAAFTAYKTDVKSAERRDTKPVSGEDIAELKAELEEKIESAPLNKFATGTIPTEDFSVTSKRVTNSVVNITAFSGNYQASSGSGVIISRDGYIITNYHVVEGGSEFTVTLANRQEILAEVIGTDPTTDLALLKVRGNNYDPLTYGDSDKVEVGQWVLAVGNPFNLASTVTAGIVSAKGRNIDIIDNAYGIESFIQTDAVVNPGNSGGALVNSRGDLIGINTAILSETGAFAGYSFAIPANLVMKVVDDLKDYGEVKRALLGIKIRDLNTTFAEELGLNSLDGVYISGVERNSTADDAGIEPGDVIVAVNDIATNSTPELQEQIARFRPGDRVSVTYFRSGKLYKKENVRLKGIR